MMLLKDYAQKKYITPLPIKQKRATFNNNRMYLRYLRRPCFVCNKPAQIRHHIVQLQHGGTNQQKNVIQLCDGCHCEIHPWLEPRENFVKEHLKELDWHGL